MSKIPQLPALICNINKVTQWLTLFSFFCMKPLIIFLHHKDLDYKMGHTFPGDIFDEMDTRGRTRIVDHSPWWYLVLDTFLRYICKLQPPHRSRNIVCLDHKKRISIQKILKFRLNNKQSKCIHLLGPHGLGMHGSTPKVTKKRSHIKKVFTIKEV